MSYQVKYFYTFRDIHDNFNKVEIYEDSTVVLTPKEIKPCGTPFMVEYPEINNKFTVIRGSGCEMNLLSETNMQFINLYTSDMFKYMVLLWDKQNNVVWCGYVNSETYTEPFNELSNYPVQVTGNDGFSLLDRLNFVDADGNHYADIKTMWDVITLILAKLNLPINYIHVKSDTTIDGQVLTAKETIFHKQYVICTNYYDEDDLPFTCKQVLEEILKPFGCFIQQVNSDIYISDINTLLSDNSYVEFKTYDGTSHLYVDDTSVNMNIGDLSTIGFAGSNQNLNIVNGINKQKLTYSPYKLTKIIEFKADDDFLTQTSVVQHGVTPYMWNEQFFTTSYNWNKFNNGQFCKLLGAEASNSTVTDAYIDIPRYTAANLDVLKGYVPACKSFTYQKLLPYLIPSGYKLKISCQMFARKTDDLENENNIASELFGLGLLCDLRIGDKKFVCDIKNININTHSGTEYTRLVKASKLYYGLWKDLTDPGCLQLDFRQALTWTDVYGVMDYKLNTAFEDTWVKLEDYYYQDYYRTAIVKDYVIPLDGITGGLMSFDIYKWDAYKPHNTIQVIYDATLDAKIKDVRIKDFNITLIDADGKEVDDSDHEFNAYLNKNFTNEGEDIKVIQGTNTSDNPVERGSILGWDGTKYTFVKNWVRQGKTASIESLLLRSIVSNYTNPSIRLTATLNKISTILGYLTCNHYLAGKKMMITGIQQDIAESTSEVSMIEISKDNLDINASYE